ncbi:hypothetical protein QQG55_11270 [Brugia pahangi]
MSVYQQARTILNRQEDTYGNKGSSSREQSNEVIENRVNFGEIPLIEYFISLTSVCTEKINYKCCSSFELNFA